MPEPPADGPVHSSPDEPAGGFESESALLTHAGAPSGIDLLDRGTMAMDEQESGLFVDLASDFTDRAGVLPGRDVADAARRRSRLEGLGWGFWLAVAWVVGITLLAIF